MEKEEMELEKQIPGEENQPQAEVEAETGAAENGQPNEAPVEDQAQEENIESDVAEQQPEAPVNEQPVQEQQPEPEPESEPEPEKMLTQSQVNELVGKARQEGRESAMKELYGRYGVNDDNEMNDIFGKGQGYDVLNDEYQALDGNYKNLSAENALLKTGIITTRWDDVKAILGMKGLDVTVENIQALLPTHQEWQNVTPAAAPEQGKEFTPEMGEVLADTAKPKVGADKQPGTIRKFGSNVPDNSNADDEDNIVKNLFGL